MVLAPRDSPPLATQGANDDASGTAALVELATVFSGAAHDHPIVFVSSDGDTSGALGARDVPRPPPRPADPRGRRAAPGRRARRARPHPQRLERAAPARASVALVARAGRRAARAASCTTPLPPVTSQILRLAIPSGGGSQAPFVAAGLAAIELSAPGPARPAVADTLDSVSTDTLTRSGRAAELLVNSLDGAPLPLAGQRQHGLLLAIPSAVGRLRGLDPGRPHACRSRSSPSTSSCAPGAGACR